MKKVGYITIGIIASIVMTYLSVSLFLNPIIKESGKSPESLMSYAYLIIYPLSLLLGSVLSGYLLSPIITKNFKSYLKHSPGVYVSIPYLIGILSAPALSLFLVLSVLANIVLSATGTLIGVKLRDQNSI